MKNEKEQSVIGNNNYTNDLDSNQQMRNNIQKVVSSSAKYLNSNYIAAINHSNNAGVEYLQQKVLKLAEQKMSRSNFLKIVSHVNSLEGNQKKNFLEQLQRQFKYVR